MTTERIPAIIQAVRDKNELARLRADNAAMLDALKDIEMLLAGRSHHTPVEGDIYNRIKTTLQSIEASR